MQFNASTGYALQMMLYLTKNRRIVSSMELTENIAVSQRYLHKIAGKLRNGGLVITKIGASGGYALDKEPSLINVYDVILLMEGGLHIPDSVAKPTYIKSSLDDSFCQLKEYVETYLRSITLDKLAN